MCQRFPLIVEKAGGINYDVNPAGSPGQVGHLRGGLPAIQHIQLQGLDAPACGANLSRRLFQLIRLPGGRKIRALSFAMASAAARPIAPLPPKITTVLSLSNMKSALCGSGSAKYG